MVKQQFYWLSAVVRSLFDPQKLLSHFAVGDSLKVCTWVAEGAGQVVSTFASVEAKPKVDSGASSFARRPRLIITEDEPSEPTAASSSFVVDPYRFSGS